LSSAPSASAHTIVCNAFLKTWIARLAELAERIRGGEAMSIWYERTGLILSDAETQSAVAQLHRLQQARP